MSRTILCFLSLLLLFAGAAYAEEPSKSATAKSDALDENGDKLISGMSIVGNDDAPKSLVIVPWKTSELGHSLDDGRQPVDRDVFMRELAYYEIRAGSH
jgi:hypothetical protein